MASAGASPGSHANEKKHASAGRTSAQRPDEASTATFVSARNLLLDRAHLSGKALINPIVAPTLAATLLVWPHRSWGISTKAAPCWRRLQNKKNHVSRECSQCREAEAQCTPEILATYDEGAAKAAPPYRNLFFSTPGHQQGDSSDGKQGQRLRLRDNFGEGLGAHET